MKAIFIIGVIAILMLGAGFGLIDVVLGLIGGLIGLVVGLFGLVVGLIGGAIGVVVGVGAVAFVALIPLLLIIGALKLLFG